MFYTEKVRKEATFVLFVRTWVLYLLASYLAKIKWRLHFFLMDYPTT